MSAKPKLYLDWIPSDSGNFGIRHWCGMEADVWKAADSITWEWRALGPAGLCVSGNKRHSRRAAQREAERAISGFLRKSYPELPNILSLTKKVTKK